MAPVGPSGIAFLGDADKLVAVGQKRIAQLQDGGTVNTTVAFAPGEQSVTVRGYAPSTPRVVSSSGASGPVSYDPATRVFSLRVSPDSSGTERLSLSL